MGKTGAFLEVERQQHGLRDADCAICDFDDIVVVRDARTQAEQASRCMACGVAFCQSGIVFAGARRASGCPLHNLIPETNDLLYRGQWESAAGRLSLTNPLPEFTGRVCPAPCETACNLGLHFDSVTIHDNERAISDWAWKQGKVRPLPPCAPDAPCVAVVGSGPAGLACAWELARRGFSVKVFEKDDRPGGLLMYGIPNMKLPKDIVMRRVELMRESGIEFFCGCDFAREASSLEKSLAAVVIATGARQARHVDIPGAELDGVIFALDYLTAATRSVLEGGDCSISAKDRDVVVLGGGDTGTDCVATAVRQKARSVTQVIRAQEPLESSRSEFVWPRPQPLAGQDYGQRDAACAYGHDPRMWSTDTIAFAGETAVEEVTVQGLSYEDGKRVPTGPQRKLPAQMVIIAKGFSGAKSDVFDALGVGMKCGLPEVEPATHRLKASEGFAAHVPCYVAGDAHTGSSLVSNAIADALACVEEVACIR